MGDSPTPPATDHNSDPLQYSVISEKLGLQSLTVFYTLLYSLCCSTVEVWDTKVRWDFS